MRYRDLAFIIAIIALIVIVAITFPIWEIQSILWITAFLFFVVCDSFATSLIKQYENLEEAGPLTRRICGPNPSTSCSFGTRILFFIILLLAYLAVAEAGVGAQFRMIVVSTVLLPLILTVFGVFILFWNIYGFLMEEIGG